MGYYFAKFISFICCLLPSGFCRWFGRFLGGATWFFIPKKRRRMAVQNIKRCLDVDNAEAESIARESWVRFGPMFFEVMRFPKIKENIREYVEYDGIETLKEELKKGRGAVLATSHSGNWELAGGAMAAEGIPMVAVAMRQKNVGFNRFITEYREQVGMHVTYKDNVREMFTLLKKGKVIALLMDQDISIRDGIIFDWFGQPTNFVQGPAVLSRFNHAPIFSALLAHIGDGRYRVTIRGPFYTEKTQYKKADILKTMKEISLLLEKHIRKYPGEWFWLHDRWKSIRHHPECLKQDSVL